MNKPIWEKVEPHPWCKCDSNMGKEFSDVPAARYRTRNTDSPVYWCNGCHNWFIQPVPIGELNP